MALLLLHNYMDFIRFLKLSGEKLIEGLQAKLLEESGEFAESEYVLEELADILEVVDGLALHLGSSFEKVLKLKHEKRSKRGGFEKGLWLEWVED